MSVDITWRLQLGQVNSKTRKQNIIYRLGILASLSLPLSLFLRLYSKSHHRESVELLMQIYPALDRASNKLIHSTRPHSIRHEDRPQADSRSGLLLAHPCHDSLRFK